MRNGSGPAAVTGDKLGRTPPFGEWEGAEARMIREPEDLPETFVHLRGNGAARGMVMKQGHPQAYGLGIFF